MTKAKSQTQKLELEFIPVHISAFQQEGKWFARAEEFQIVAHGDSELAATRRVYNMAQRSVFFAAEQGTLPAILKKAGVKVRTGVPQDDTAQSDHDNLWFLSLTHRADHVRTA